MTGRILLSVLSVLSLAVLQAAAVEVGDFTYRHLGREEGLLNQQISTICQTRDGALWWTTKHTVDRYNGQEIRHYTIDESGAYHLYSGRTISLALSDDGALFAYDNKGRIFRYDSDGDAFVKIEDLTQRCGHSVILNEMQPAPGGMWLALDQGAYFLGEEGWKAVLEGPFVRRILQAGGQTFLCTRKGVFTVTVPDASPVFRLPLDVESGFFDAASRLLWLGCFSEGLHILEVDRPGVVFASVEGFPHNPIRSIIRYDSATLMVGVDGCGVYAVPTLKDRAPRARLLMDANPGPQGVLHGNGIYALLADCWGDLFIGSYSGGIDIAEPGRGFSLLPRDKSLHNLHVNCVSRLSDGRLAVGTDNGLEMLDAQGNELNTGGKGLVVLAACTYGRHQLLATFGRGVYETDGYHLWQKSARSLGNLEDDHVYSLFVDASGGLWMGFLDGDLQEETAGIRRRYPVRNVQDILQLPDGRIAVGTANGVCMVVPGRTETTELAYYPPEEAEKANRYVLDLFLRESELWVATDGGGIYRYNLETAVTTHLTTSHGLPSNSVCSLTEDGQGRVWVATANGLCYISGNGTVVPVNYWKELDREYVRGAATRLDDGRILLGYTDGALLIEPESLVHTDYTARLRLVEVEWKGRSAHPEIRRRMLEEHQLDLPYSGNTFTLRFESIHLRYRDDIVYQYCVGDEEWSTPSRQTTARFTELASGSHPLTIRSLSRSSGRELDRITLDLNIGEPWWSSDWMRLVYMLLLLGAFVGAWRIYRLHTWYKRRVINSPEIHNEETVISSSSEGKDFVDKVTAAVVARISDPDLSIDGLCRDIGVSRTGLYVRLKTYTGESPQDFIRFIRLERAATLLRSGHPVADVSSMVGFDNPKYFSTVFKKYFGVSPSKYN